MGFIAQQVKWVIEEKKSARKKGKEEEKRASCRNAISGFAEFTTKEATLSAHRGGDKSGRKSLSRRKRRGRVGSFSYAGQPMPSF